MQTKDIEILPGGMPIFRPEDISLLDIQINIVIKAGLMSSLLYTCRLDC